MVSREPEAVTICCSLVPANCPSMAWVIEDGAWIVREYMNMLDVAAMLSGGGSARRLSIRLKGQAKIDVTLDEGLSLQSLKREPSDSKEIW